MTLKEWWYVFLFWGQSLMFLSGEANHYLILWVSITAPHGTTCSSQPGCGQALPGMGGCTHAQNISHSPYLTYLSSHVCPHMSVHSVTWPLHVIMTLTASNWCMCAVRLSKHWLSSEMRAEDLQLLWLAWLQDMESVLIIASLQPRMILGCFSGL